MRFYPISLNLQGRKGVVIGGGAIAEGKVQGLLEAEANLTVISPELTRRLKALAAEGKIAHINRTYQPGDLAGAFLAISATDDRAVNEQVCWEAAERDVLINVVDDPSHCTFIAPSIVRKGDLTIALSTGGKAPALAVRLGEGLGQMVGHEAARFFKLAGALRGALGGGFPGFAPR